MPIEDFNIREQLGKGSFGKVIKVIRKSDGQTYAMKLIKLIRLKEKDKKNALNQIRFLASIKHPNVVGYRQAFYEDKSENLCIIMDFANEGDLATKIKKHIETKIRIKEELIWKVAFDVISGLDKIHQSKIIHRDIKPANVFFNEGRAQLGDLNVAKHLKDPFTVTQTGTPYYASPEVWSEEPYNYKSDIWSLGCVLYQMAMLRPPFRAQTPQKLFKKILLGVYDAISPFYSKELSNFIEKLLTLCQKNRPDTKQLLCQPKMMELRQGGEDEEGDKRLIQTIQFPKNLKFLNENLPKPKYNQESQIKWRTAKILKTCQEAKQKEGSKQSIPSIQLIRSEKNIQKDGPKGITIVRRTKILNKNGSQKLIL